MFPQSQTAGENLTKTKVDIVQINLGNKCNQKCTHCHIGASPNGEKNMDYATAKKILTKLLSITTKRIEFTGGTPELNPNFKMFIEKLSKNKDLAVRTSLTILENPEYSFFIDFYRQHGVKIIASLPSVFKDLTDKQRGKGVFASSIKVLKRLNSIGYGTGDLALDLVYNPAGDYLPPDQTALEDDYRQFLNKLFNISFDNLITIVNSPLKRFKNYLQTHGELDEYIKNLTEKYNPETLHNLMCRHLISVDYQGNVYDCDFNLASGIRIKGYEDVKFWEIDFDSFASDITFGEHCYACTVNRGSSCHGALIKERNNFDAKEVVKEYYGNTLKDSSSLKTSACCTADSVPEHVREALTYIAEEIKMKYYGCGSPIPLALDSLSVLDLGCGTGRDSYILSKMVGENGFVYGIDMTDKQIHVAGKYLEYQMERFGYDKPNVRFIHDYIENAGSHFPEECLDLVVSNCVVNLVEDKESVLREIYRILRNGGEFYFSDIYADRRIPEHLRKEPVLYGECLGGALYIKDFERIAKKTGFKDPRIVSKRVVNITDRGIIKLTGNITFYSVTYRLWKIPELEDSCEDYGHVAVYKGGLQSSPFKFELDGSHVFEKNRPERVCGNTALMLSETRFKKYFQISGNFDEHFGIFENCKNVNTSDSRDMPGDDCNC